MHVEVLVRVMVQDLSQFMLVFAVIMVTLGGGLFFALRGEPCPKPMEVGNMSMGFDKAINTSLCIYPAQTRLHKLFTLIYRKISALICMFVFYQYTVSQLVHWNPSFG